MTQTDLEKIVEVSIGEKNIEVLAEKRAWEEFTPFDKKVLELYKGAMDCMRNGNLDAKRLVELNESFDAASRELTNKITFGHDQNGIRVTSEQLFGEIKAMRPEYLPYLAAKFEMLWAVERKLRLHYEEKSGKKTTYEAMRLTGV